MAVATRVLIAELDSPAQARRFAEKGARQAIADLSGMLRAGMLISSTVLVTDAMLLDGEYFIALGSDGFLREMGTTQARFPLTITGRSGSLREGLQERLDNPSFRWSLAGLSDGSVPDDVRRAWEDWIRVVDSGIVTYERQPTSTAPLRAGSPPPLPEPAQEQLVQAGLAEERYRSAAWATIESMDADDIHRADLREWWNDAYLRMIAENASADWLSFDSTSARPMAVRPGDISLPLSTRLREWARDSTPTTIALAWDASGSQRRRLHEQPTWRRMRDLSFAVTQVAIVQSRASVLVGSTAKLLVALVVVALALPGLQIGSLDSPWTWVAFVGAIATTVPFDSLWALLGLLRRDPRARLVLHRGAPA